MRKAGSGGGGSKKKPTKVKYVKAYGALKSSKVGGGGGGAGSKKKKLPKYGTPGNPSAGTARAYSRSVSRSRGGEPSTRTARAMGKKGYKNPIDMEGVYDSKGYKRMKNMTRDMIQNMVRELKVSKRVKKVSSR